MSGNVGEMVADWYDARYYVTLEDGVVNPRGPEGGDLHVLRGGSWASTSPSRLDARDRRPYSNLRVRTNGFRCARSAIG